MTDNHVEDENVARSERWQLLRTLDRVLEGPLVVLSFVWLAILAAEFIVGTDARLDALFYTIWAVFVVEVVIELVIAPDRTAYLRGNWLKVIALLIPALRALRVLRALRFLRAARAVRSASMLRLLTSLNRGMGALGRTLDRARFVYVVALTVLVILIGAAGLLFFERPESVLGGAQGGSVITSYGEALWWTAMAMTTVGTDYFPVTPEGRLLAWLLSLFAIGVFGYVTATMAGHFLGIEAAGGQPARDDLLTRELAELRNEIAALRQRLPDPAE